jgi:hypothetical protein
MELKLIWKDPRRKRKIDDIIVMFGRKVEC